MVATENKPSAKLMRPKTPKYSISSFFTKKGSIEVWYDYGKEYDTAVIKTSDIAQFIIENGFDYSQSYDLGTYIFENMFEVVKRYLTAKDFHNTITRVRLHP